jgi:ribose/xylose/arabinose/galactoside ABC-type transport system permease subunit
MPNDPRLRTRLRSLVDQLGPLLALIGVWSLFAFMRWDIFPTWENTQSILLQTAVIGIAALGGTMVIISGGIDLSVGSLIALVSVAVALVLRRLGEAGAGADGDWHGYGAAALAAAMGVAVAGLCGLSIGTMVIGRVGRIAALIIGCLAGCWLGAADWTIAAPFLLPPSSPRVPGGARANSTCRFRCRRSS